MTRHTAECTTKEDCSSASDTCISNVCFCGSNETCAGRTDTCTAGQCKCGENDECSSPRTCLSGKCIGKYLLNM